MVVTLYIVVAGNCVVNNPMIKKPSLAGHCR